MVSNLCFCGQSLLADDSIGVNREKVKQHTVSYLLSAVMTGRSRVDNLKPLGNPNTQI
jgi:hypothetical protein